MFDWTRKPARKNTLARKRTRLTTEVLEDRSIPAVLGGVDGLVFTAGIGENSPEIRRRICEASAWLGIEIDQQANEGKGTRISRDRSRVSAWVIPTNEELMIARHTGIVLGLLEASA